MEFWDLFLKNLYETQLLEFIAVALGVIYVLLAARESVWCWPVSLTGVTIYIFLCYDAQLYSETVLQIFYFVLAFYGWHQWLSHKSSKQKVIIHRQSILTHLAAVSGIVFISLGVGYALSLYTNAALPYLDSLTTVASIYTTYLVAKKVLENWIYWIVIDALSVYLYASREMASTAVLYAFFTLIALNGYRIWLKKWKKTNLSA